MARHNAVVSATVPLNANMSTNLPECWRHAYTTERAHVGRTIRQLLHLGQQTRSHGATLSGSEYLQTDDHAEQMQFELQGHACAINSADMQERIRRNSRKCEEIRREHMFIRIRFEDIRGHSKGFDDNSKRFEGIRKRYKEIRRDSMDSCSSHKTQCIWKPTQNAKTNSHHCHHCRRRNITIIIVIITRPLKPPLLGIAHVIVWRWHPHCQLPPSDVHGEFTCGAGTHTVSCRQAACTANSPAALVPAGLHAGV